MKKVMVAVLLSLIGVVLLLASWPVYFVREVTGQNLLCNGQEAYLFLQVHRNGYRLCVLQYGLEYVRAYLRVGGQPWDDTYSYVVVLRVTPETVQRSLVENTYIGHYVPMGQSIYGNLMDANNSGEVLKWAGERFEPATLQETEKFRASRLPPTFNQIDGWSKKDGLSGFDAENKYTFEIGSESVSLIVKTVDVSDMLSMDLLRTGKPPERIWYLDQRPRKVTKAEYQQSFRKP